MQNRLKPYGSSVSGEAMDRVVPGGRRRRIAVGGFAAALIFLAGIIVWQVIPRGLAVDKANIQIGTVRAGQLRDELLLRAIATPFDQVRLDATETGRVEVVAVKDGALVKRGDLLFRLSNPQREQEVLGRAADVAQQVANIATLRAAQEVSRAEQGRRIRQLEYELDRAQRAHARNVSLFEKGFLSTAALEESEAMKRLQQHLLDQARVDANSEELIRRNAISELERVVVGLNKGLRIVRATVDALAVRAPIDGRLTDFRLEVGESVKPGDRMGRVDSPGRFRLVAPVDEFYAARTTPGLEGQAEINGVLRPVVLKRVNQQVKDRRFDIELEFANGPEADLQAGQTIDTRLTLGQSKSALLLSDGAFFAETGGAWVYVVANGGRSAERKVVKLGRRAAGEIEVLEGLTSGEQVIVSSYGSFGDALRLRINN